MGCVASRCSGAPAGSLGTRREAGQAGGSSERCLYEFSGVFLLPSGNSRPDTPLGDLPNGEDFVSNFAEALFGENILCLTSLQFIWLTRHLPVLDFASPPLPSLPLAFSVKRNNSTSHSPEEQQQLQQRRG